jgi:hypothetical protein
VICWVGSNKRARVFFLDKRGYQRNSRRGIFGEGFNQDVSFFYRGEQFLNLSTVFLGSGNIYLLGRSNL